MVILANSLARLHTLVQSLPPRLQEHLFRVRSVALELASKHNVDASKVELAALGHDLMRAESGEQLIARARAIGLPVHLVEEHVPILLHGPLAAEQLEKDCGITDSEVLEAVRWHSTSCPCMSKVGLVVFLADKLDPQKIKGKPEQQKLAEIANVSLEQAVVQYLTAEIHMLMRQGNLVHPMSVEARNCLLMKAVTAS